MKMDSIDMKAVKQSKGYWELFVLGGHLEYQRENFLEAFANIGKILAGLDDQIDYMEDVLKRVVDKKEVKNVDKSLFGLTDQELLFCRLRGEGIERSKIIKVLGISTYQYEAWKEVPRIQEFIENYEKE